MTYTKLEALTAERDELIKEAAALRNALVAFCKNSTSHDWPDGMYDAAMDAIECVFKGENV